MLILTSSAGASFQENRPSASVFNSWNNDVEPRQDATSTLASGIGLPAASTTRPLRVRAGGS